MTPALVQTLDYVRNLIEEIGFAPTLDEIATATGTTKTMAHKRIADLVHLRKLKKTSNRTRGIELADVPDMRAVRTAALAAELARRGVENAVSHPKPRRAVGRQPTCAADTCGNAVERGHLMCRPHWLKLPYSLRTNLIAAHRLARQTEAAADISAYQQLLGEARDIADGLGAR